MTLRRQIVLTVTALLLTATATSATAAWYLFSQHTLSEIDHALQERARAVVGTLQTPYDNGVDDHGEPSTIRDIVVPAPPYGEAGGYTQIVTEADPVAAPAGSTQLDVTPADLEVARGGAELLSTRSVQGTDLRLVTTQVRPGIAVMIARPLDEMQANVRRLALLLTLIALATCVLGASSADLIARWLSHPIASIATEVAAIAENGNPSQRVSVLGTHETRMLAGGVNTMLTSLERALTAQQDLTAETAHELRTPLTVLRTDLDSIRPSNPKQKVLLDEAHTQLMGVITLVNDLLRLHAPEAPGERDEVDLGAACAETVRRYQRISPAHHIVLTADDSTVWGDSADLERVVSNLIDNACKWSPPSEPIYVTVAEGSITVDDAGPGVPTDQFESIFTRFHRSPLASEKTGAGLGLAIVAKIVSAHHGSVSASGES